MSTTLFGHLWRAQRNKILIVCLAMAGWSLLLPVVYQSFGSQMQALMNSGIFPKELMSFGGGDVFSLGGSIALGYVHPISIILVAIFAIGFTTAAIAGERQRGTLEVLLARPLSRLSLYVTELVAALVFVALILAAAAIGTVIGAVLAGVADQLAVERLPMLWLNGMLLWGAIAAIGLAASVSFDQFTPAIGVTVAIVIVMYFLDILGSLWPDAKGLQPYSLFHYLAAREILAGTVKLSGLAVLAAVGGAAIAYAVIVFPRRDLAAPS